MLEIDTLFRTKMAKKNIPFGTAHTYIAYIREYAPSPPGRKTRCRFWVSLLTQARLIANEQAELRRSKYCSRQKNSRSCCEKCNISVMQGRLQAVSYFSLQSYCTRNLSTRAAKPRVVRNEGVSPRRKNKRLLIPQGPEEMCLSLEHQNPSKTSEKMGYFDRVTVSLHIL